MILKLQVSYRKQVSVLLLALTSFYAQAQIVDIPDTNFKNALINHDPVIDSNSDGEIQVSEALATNMISVSGQNIADITGIEAFLNLEQFTCSNNDITNLDLSANTNLGIVQCQVNAYTDLDFTNNVNLSLVNCGSANLANLQLPNITSQIAVYCANGELSSLDVTQLPGLIVLAASGNNISSMDLSQNGNLDEVYLDNNILTSVNLDGASNLTRLQINNNPIEEVDITGNLEINTLVFGDTGITSMDLSNHDQLIGVFGENNLLETINLKNGNNELLTFLDLTNNPNLDCIQVDDEVMATNGTGSYELWMKDTFAVYSEDCPVLGLGNNTLETISVYPNPTLNVVQIESPVEIDLVHIFNIQGQMLFSQYISGKNFRVNLEDLASGSYFIKLQTEYSIKTMTIIRE